MTTIKNCSMCDLAFSVETENAAYFNLCNKCHGDKIKIKCMKENCLEMTSPKNVLCKRCLKKDREMEKDWLLWRKI
tara:strand:- start:934 stop:1161 length:228 start_codon:yes stop_codon:yes gene_type:complete